MGAAALVVAGAAGFGVARLTDRPAVPAPATPAVEGAQGVLQLPAEYLAAAGIAVQPAAEGALGAEVLAPATLQAPPGGEAAATAHAAGSVVRLLKRLGDPVRAGETLALVESREAAAAAADRAAAEARLVLARKDAAREQGLYAQKVSPRRDLEAAEAALAAAEAEARRARSAAAAVRLSGDGRTVAVTSPIAGRITAQAAALGAFVQPETELFRVSSGEARQAEAQVPAADAARIRPGDPAEVLLSSGAAVPAKVRSVAPALDPETRAAAVVLTLADEVRGALVGEAAQARIQGGGSGRRSVLVPEEAVQRVDGREVVYVRTAKGFAVQPVQVGARAGGRAEVLAGLRAGQAVATRNAFLLKAELGKGAEDEE